VKPEKKQLEILLINYFRESFTDFPKGIIVPSESPDFILSLKTKNQLGIELTRLNPGNASPPDFAYLLENESRDRFINFVKELVEKDIRHQLFVKFLFSDHKKINTEKELIATLKTAGTIREKISGKKRESFFRISIPSAELPEGLDEVLIVNHPALLYSMWERSNNLGVSNDVVDDIRNSIRKKDEKLKLYQKQRLNYYWLLIVTDRLRGVKNFNLQNKIINHKFNSRFQHVYLFDLIKANVFELV
jgi:hypothetical protein